VSKLGVEHVSEGIAQKVKYPPGSAAQTAGQAPRPGRPVAALRNRIETAYGEIIDHLELARHGTHIFWGLFTRVAGTLAAHTLLRLHLI
jgi:hypothetical protein